MTIKMQLFFMALVIVFLTLLATSNVKFIYDQGRIEYKWQFPRWMDKPVIDINNARYLSMHKKISLINKNK